MKRAATSIAAEKKTGTKKNFLKTGNKNGGKRRRGNCFEVRCSVTIRQGHGTKETRNRAKSGF